MTEIADPSTLAAAPGPGSAPRPGGPAVHVRGPRARGGRWPPSAPSPPGCSRTGSPRSRLFEALPVETNQLYTPYVDLRAASLDGRAPYGLTGAAAACPAAGAPRGRGRAARDARGRRRGRWPCRTRPARPASGSSRWASWSATDEPLARGAARPAAPCPRGREARPAVARGLVRRACSSTSRPASAWTQPIVLRWAVGAPRLRHRAHADRPRRRRRGLRGRGAGDVATASVAGAQALLCATTEIRLGAHARLAMASLQETRPGPGRVPAAARGHRRGRGPALGARPARRAASCARAWTTSWPATGARSSRSRSCSASDDQLFDLTSYTRHVGRDTTGHLLSKGVLMDRARAYMKGLITIEKTAIGTDSYLGEFGMNLSKAARAVAIPSPRDRPAGLPPRGPLVVRRPDRRDAALLPREPRDPARTRRASSSSSGSWSRSWPGSRSRRRRIACARRWRPSGTPASRAPGRHRRPDRPPAARRRPPQSASVAAVVRRYRRPTAARRPSRRRPSTRRRPSGSAPADVRATDRMPPTRPRSCRMLVRWTVSARGSAVLVRRPPCGPKSARP